MCSLRVFVSYSWEDEEHVAWVTGLAARLRNDGIDTWLDRWAMSTQPLALSLGSEIRHADAVLVVCTPDYQKKAAATDDAQPSGVLIEARIISARLFHEGLATKVVPVLARGVWESAIPDFLIGELYYDLSIPRQFEVNYRALLLRLGQPQANLDREPAVPLRGSDQDKWDLQTFRPGSGKGAESQLEDLFEACVQLGRLVVFSRREIIAYPHPEAERTEKARYFFNVISERFFVALLKSRSLMSPEAAEQSEKLRAMFDNLWMMAETAATRESRLALLADIDKATDHFMQSARDGLSQAAAADLQVLKTVLARQFDLEIKVFFDLVELQVLPYPHADPKQNADARWYFTEKLEGIAAKMIAFGLVTPALDTSASDSMRQQWDVLWAMAIGGLPIEQRHRQYLICRDALTRTLD